MFLRNALIVEISIIETFPSFPPLSHIQSTEVQYYDQSHRTDEPKTAAVLRHEHTAGTPPLWLLISPPYPVTLNATARAMGALGGEGTALQRMGCLTQVVAAVT
jgi:hypothetical protein